MIIEDILCFYIEDLYNEVIVEFTNYSYNENTQSLLLYRAIHKFCKLVKDNPENMVSGLLFLNGLMRILLNN